MNPELPFVLLPPIGWGLWTWGGLNWKPARRFIWPTVALGWLFLKGIGWPQAVATGILMAVVLSIGYGDSSRLRAWLGRWAWVAYGLLLGLSTILVGLTVWHFVVAAWFPIGMYLSQEKPNLAWKSIEGLTGVFQALTLL